MAWWPGRDLFYKLIWRNVRAKAYLQARSLKTEQPEPFTKYENDFPGFCKDILGITLWDGQIDIGNKVLANPYVTVAACYASGKTFTSACLVLFWIYTRRPAMVITTAPTGRQVKSLLWREIRKLHRKAKVRLPGRMLQTQLIIAEDWWGMGFASNAPNSVAGLHEAKNVLFIEDEAAGMSSEVVEGFEGITASENSRWLKIGNPICVSGPFFDSHMNPEESARWTRVSINALDTPNVKAGKQVVPGLVTAEWVADKETRWLKKGLKHLWNTKVRGEFYVTAQEKLIPAAWVIAAQQRAIDAGGFLAAVAAAGAKNARRILGVDVAGAGQDETVAYLRQGQVAQLVDRWQEPDLMVGARRVVTEAHKERANQINVDQTGLGKGLFDKIVEMADSGLLPQGCDAHGIIMNESPDDTETFAARIDEIMWRMREAFDPSSPFPMIIDPDDKQLAEELSHRGWSIDERFKIKVESKRSLRKRGVDSPDSADSLSTTFAGREVAIAWG